MHIHAFGPGGSAAGQGCLVSSKHVPERIEASLLGIGIGVGITQVREVVEQPHDLGLREPQRRGVDDGEFRSPPDMTAGVACCTEAGMRPPAWSLQTCRSAAGSVHVVAGQVGDQADAARSLPRASAIRAGGSGRLPR
jgi:hypothetical protein